MKECIVLNYVKKLSVLIDREAKGKIGRWEYYNKLSELCEKIDKAVIRECPILKTHREEQDGTGELDQG